MDRSVLAHTNFVSARRIGLRHRAWTYRAPGGGEDEISADSIEELTGQLNDRPRTATLDRHLSVLLQRLAGESIDASVDLAVRGIDDVPEDTVAAVSAVIRLRLIGLELSAIGASWWLREPS